MENLKELLKKFIEWVEENSEGDFFYVFEYPDKAIEAFLKQRNSQMTPEARNDGNTLLATVVSDMDIETAAVNTYKGKDLNEQRANLDKIVAFEKGAKWALSKLSNNGS